MLTYIGINGLDMCHSCQQLVFLRKPLSRGARGYSKYFLKNAVCWHEWHISTILCTVPNHVIITVAIVPIQEITMMLYPTDCSGCIDSEFFDAWFSGLKPGRYVSAELCKAYKESYKKTGSCNPPSAQKIKLMLAANGCKFIRPGGVRQTIKP